MASAPRSNPCDALGRLPTRCLCALNSQSALLAAPQVRSLEKSAGSERKLDALKLKKLISAGKIPGAITSMGQMPGGP